MPLPPNRNPRISVSTGYVLVAERIADGLRQEILDWKLRPGQRIPQQAVAEQYRVSRLPVRQALQRLETEGLVTFTAHVGARVITLDPKDVDELYEMRERLESLAVAESAAHLSKEQLAELRGLHEKMKKIGSDDRKRWIRLDRSFHLLMYAGAPLPRVRRLVEELWNVVQPYRLGYAALPEAVSLAHREHRLMLKALTEGDAEEAARSVATHIRRSRLALLERPELLEIPR